MTNPAIFHGEPNQKQCAFTFDDGPHHLPLEAWMEALEQCGALGTFFFTGAWIDQHPQQARTLIARGHELAPHSYHHRRMSELSRDVFFEEIKLTELAFQEATGLPCPTFMRFPYRAFTEENLDWLAEWGYVDIEGEDSGDWAGLTSQQIMSNVLPSLYNGSIVVHHANDIAQGTPGALKPLIRSARNKGLSPIKVSDMLIAMGITPKYRSWKIRIDVPANVPYVTEDWIPIRSSNDLNRLAAETCEWSLAQIPHGYASELQWQKHLSEPLEMHNVVENRDLFAGRRFADQYWAYVRAGVSRDELVLLDFAVKEAQADALVYLLRWAAKTAAGHGCKRIVARQDIRRIEQMCRQMGWTSDIVLEDS